MNWKHLLVIAAGAGLPVLAQELQGDSLLSLVSLGHDLASAGLVAIAAALKSFLGARGAS